ncbi:universal stress protein [Streptosporangium sp. LJ11]|uniref:universal stress protein n=1 Tax=Streptosporangium sp. LJ11 TaxID=3436927 RepID=UPI003F794A29
MTHVIVVGADGSAAGTAAVEWAADDAARADRPLRIVYAVDRWPYQISKFPNPVMGDVLERGARRVLAEAEEVARKRQPGIEVTTEPIEGTAVSVLRAQAEHADELVVGARGLGGFAGAVMGSVSVHVAGHAHGAVVVVRAGQQSVHGQIVVGVDDSPACEPALAYAFAQAALRGATVRAIHAWQAPVHVYAPEITYDLDEVGQAHQQAAADRLRGRQERHPQVRVVHEVVCAHPVDALTRASAEADLVVVGSHGRGAVSSAILGSVSRAVLLHAGSAVAVVRSTTD